MRLLGVCPLLLLIVAVVLSRPSDDLVKYIPGYAGFPNFRVYSGYLDGKSPNIQLHYVFVEAQKNPCNASLILWLNGGPGCSSLLGMFTENGPLLSQRGNRLLENTYSWNKYANIVYLESPAGVGFSFARDGNVTTDDDLVAENNYFAVVNFFNKFPEFKGRDFYIIGESYGGVYVPTLALRVANHPDIRLKGVAVDNGLTSYALNDNSLLYFAYYHSLLDSSLWADLVTYCCGGKLIGRCLFTLNPDPQCQKAIDGAVNTLSYGLNMYNLYAPCAGGVPSNGLSTPVRASIFRHGQWVQRMSRGPGITENQPRFNRVSREQIDRRNLFRFSVRNGRRFLKSPLIISCSDDSVLTEYLNMAVVRSAFNIPDSVAEWSSCSEEVYNNYKRVYFDLKEQYMTLLKEGIRVHLFNGDVDMACNALGDEWFAGDLGLPLRFSRHPWFFNATDGTRQIGGYTKSFVDVNSSTVLTFSTVRGAGHMVPADKPLPAFTLFHDFLLNCHQ